MPVMNGIEASKEIKRFNPNTIIVILSAYDQKNKVLEAFNAGVNAYCVKQIKIKELVNIFDIVSNGGIWIDTQIAGYIFEVLKHLEEGKTKEREEKQRNNYNITSRERNVLKLVSDGLSNDEIAQQLVISRNTVKNHIASIINKLSVKDRTQAAIFAIKNIFND